MINITCILYIIFIIYNSVARVTRMSRARHFTLLTHALMLGKKGKRNV